MNGRESDPLDAAARVLAGREVHWTLVVLCLLFLATALPLGPLRVPGYLLLVAFDAPQNAVLPGLDSLAFWAGFAGYLYVLSLVVGAVFRVVGRRFRRREPRVRPAARPRRSRLPSLRVLVTTAQTVLGPEVIVVFVVLAGLGYAAMANVPFLRVPGGVVLALLGWGVLGESGSPLALASLVVTSYLVAVGVGNLAYLLRRG